MLEHLEPKIFPLEIFLPQGAEEVENPADDILESPASVSNRARLECSILQTPSYIDALLIRVNFKDIATLDSGYSFP